MAEIQYIVTEREWRDFQDYRNDDLPNKIKALSEAIGRYKVAQIDHRHHVEELQELIEQQEVLIEGYKAKLKGWED